MLNWKVQHNILHHTYTNIEGLDEDIDAPGPLRLSEQQPLKKIHKCPIYSRIFLLWSINNHKIDIGFCAIKKI